MGVPLKHVFPEFLARMKLPWLGVVTCDDTPYTGFLHFPTLHQYILDSSLKETCT